MRTEEEIQAMADKASSTIANGKPVHPGVLEYKGKIYDLGELRGVRDALDWALDEDVEDDPV